MGWESHQHGCQLGNVPAEPWLSCGGCAGFQASQQDIRLHSWLCCRAVANSREDCCLIRSFQLSPGTGTRLSDRRCAYVVRVKGALRVVGGDGHTAVSACRTQSHTWLGQCMRLLLLPPSLPPTGRSILGPKPSSARKQRAACHSAACQTPAGRRSLQGLRPAPLASTAHPALAACAFPGGGGAAEQPRS